MKSTLLFAKSASLTAAAVLLCACGPKEAAAPAPVQSAPSASAPAATQTTARVLSPLERGAKVYKKCKSCHSLEQGGRHKIGPNMWEIYGTTAGMKEGFAYSKAMRESGIVWDDATLSAYLENPRKSMPGNRMSFVGLRKAEDREAVLLYIKDQTTPK